MDRSREDTICGSMHPIGGCSICAETLQPDSKRGLYGKYIVKRLDGSSEAGGKHYDCRYYVLDLEHDKHARAALIAYAKSCAKEYPELAADLRRLARPRTWFSRFFNRKFGDVNAPRFGRQP